MQTINVKVTKLSGRRYWMMYYDDKVLNRRFSRSSKETSRRDAERAAARWEAELRSGTYKPSNKIDWQEFRERYEDEVLPGLAVKTRAMMGTVFAAFEKHCRPGRLAGVTSDVVSAFQTCLRKTGVAEATIKSYSAHLKAAIRWAVEMDMLTVMPKIKMPKRAKGTASSSMKGRPITGEEFDRMLAKVEVGLRGPAGSGEQPKRRAAQAAWLDRRAAVVAPRWRYLLRGLWLSGLRLGEAINLYWDRDDRIRVRLDGRRSMLWIPAEMEKGHRDRLIPITPDFAEFLEATPEGERTGPVFKPAGVRSDARMSDPIWVGKVISRIGRLAGVKVSEDARTSKVKYASAHDFRRAFGARWSTRVVPVVLQTLMRHEDIKTTLAYYVGQNAEAVADAIWCAAERMNTLVDTSSVEGAKEVGFSQK